MQSNTMTIRRFNCICAALLVGLVFSQISSAQNQPQVGPYVLKHPEIFHPNGPDALSDRAMGLLDKGELANLFTNYGILADYHLLGTPAMHWPRAGTDVQQYGFGVGMILVADRQVVKSIYDPSSPQLGFGWEAADGSQGLYYNSTRTPSNTAGDGVTPFLAFSDIPDTWPVSGGVPFWPGSFREDLQNPGQYVPGEFVSDRDVFGVLQDNYNLGLIIKQTGYSYGRYYAEDFFFVRFRLVNTGTANFDSCFLGFQADLRPDFYADDLIQYWTLPGDENPSFFYKWDYNGLAQRTDSSLFGELWEGPVGYVGIGLVESPDSMGVTSFHFYNDDNSPVEDAYYTAILNNQNNAPLDSLQWYFHGSDSTFDDPALWQEVDVDPYPGAKITFMFGSGPFSLTSGDSVDFTLVFVIGADSLALRDNTEMAYFMARQAAYQGSGPPLTPNLTAVPGDGQIHLYWDSRAESSVDAISGEMDFEGYKLYKSTDAGLTWGEPVTNYFGEIVGWLPIAQFDLVDSVVGLDPTYGPLFPNANQWLGDDTGIQHAFTDSNVINGQEVWYGVTAYDRGYYNEVDPLESEPSYESSIGVSAYDVNIAVVTPSTQASNVTMPTASPFVEINGWNCDGTLALTIVDPTKLLDHVYEITFNNPGDTISAGADTIVADDFSLNLEDSTTQSYYFINDFTGEGFNFVNQPLAADGLPIVNGFRLVVNDLAEPGISSIGWTTVVGDTSTFDWWTEDREPTNPQHYGSVVEGIDDWRITILAPDDSTAIPMIALGFMEESDSVNWMPIRVERAITEIGGVWVDATGFAQLSDLTLYPPFYGSSSLGPYGWDLIPGGAGYNPNPSYSYLWPDILVLRDDAVDSTGSMIWLFTQNGPDSTLPPSPGDVFTINTLKPFYKGLTYRFSTEAQSVLSDEPDLSRIKVVPNPFIVTSGLESNPYESKVMFTHLPTQCEITIFTVAGNRVITLPHQSSGNEGYTYWDLRNHQGQNVAYGVYIYVVKTPEGSSHTGKMMVIR